MNEFSSMGWEYETVEMNPQKSVPDQKAFLSKPDHNAYHKGNQMEFARHLSREGKIGTEITVGIQGRAHPSLIIEKGRYG